MKRLTAGVGVAAMACGLWVSAARAQHATLENWSFEPRLSFAGTGDVLEPEAARLSFAQPEDDAAALTFGSREAGGEAQAAEAWPGKERIPFGWAGAECLTFGAGLAHNFRQETDYNLHFAWSRFLADEVEFAIEGGGWYFDQHGDDTAGLNGNLVFRWHLLHPEETTATGAWDWTVYTDLGIGLMGTFDNVPATGTGFTFTPRAGGGFTKQIGDDGTRLQVGVRWHHISNGRIEGDLRNPARDSVMVYAGIIIPF